MFMAANTPARSVSLIEGWYRQVGCTSAELDAAVDAILAAPPSLPAERDRLLKSPPPDWTRIVNELAEDYGLEEKHWLWEKDAVDTIRAWNRSRAVHAAMGGNVVSHGRDPVDEAVKSLAVAKAIIIAEHEKDAVE